MRLSSKIFFFLFTLGAAGISSLFLEEDFLVLISGAAIITAAIVEMRRDRTWENDISSRLTACETSLGFLDEKIEYIQDAVFPSDRKRGDDI